MIRSTVNNLELKLKSLKNLNSSLKEELEAYKNMDNNFEIIKPNEIRENKRFEEEVKRIDEQLKQEIKARERAEKELESQLFLKKEAETAMQLLERDVLEKQDTVVTLRRQLEDIKLINLQMYNKLQDLETSIKNKSNHIFHLEQNISVMANTISQLESK